MKSFAPKPWVVPQPVLIIGTYNKKGVANAMNAAWAGQWDIEKATMVNAPVFTDFPMTLECRIMEKYDESETGYYLVAEIVNILIDEKYLAEDGNPDIEKMELIVFDPIHHSYIQLGEKVGNAFSDGKALK